MAKATGKVELTADFKDVIAKIGDLDQKFDAATRSMKGQAEKVGSSFGDIFKGVLAGNVATAGLGMLSSGVGKIAEAMIGGNAEMERYTVQFGVLLGSADAAKERIDELSKFAAKTPFELPEVVQASKLLQTFGGDAIATGDVLTMTGDMAAASGAQFGEIATWVGRAYTNMQAGKPFGEAAQRLQELGLMSGEARAKLEGMQASGASGAEVWAQFQKSMGGFGGMMEKQANTWEGLVSTLNDTLAQLGRGMGAPLFKAAREGLIKVLEVLNKPEMIGAFEKMGEAIGKLLGPAIEMVGPLIEYLVPVFATWAEVAAQLLPPLGDLVKILIGAIMPVIPIAQDLLAKLAPVFVKLAYVVANLVRNLAPLVEVLAAEFAKNIDVWIPLLDSVVEALAASAPLIATLTQLLIPLIQAGAQVNRMLITPFVEFEKFTTGVGKNILEFFGDVTDAMNRVDASKAQAAFDAERKRAMEQDRGVAPDLPDVIITEETDDERAAQSAKDREKYLKRMKALRDEQLKDLGRAQKQEIQNMKELYASDAELAATDAEHWRARIELLQKYGMLEDTVEKLKDETAKHELDLSNQRMARNEESFQREQTLMQKALDAATRRMDEEKARYKDFYDSLEDRQKDELDLLQQLGAVDPFTLQMKRRELELDLARKRIELLDKEFEAEKKKLEVQLEQYKLAEKRARTAIERKDAAEKVAATEREIDDKTTKHKEDNAKSVERVNRIIYRNRELSEKEYGEMLMAFSGETKNALLAAGQEIFGQSKGFAVAQATINTFEGATKALATYPPPFGEIAAAAVVGLGLAQVSNILKQEPRKFAEGGVVMAPVVGMVGEAGREAVVPLDRLPGIIADSVYLAFQTRGGNRSPLAQRRPERIEGRIQAVTTVQEFGHGMKKAELHRSQTNI